MLWVFQEYRAISYWVQIHTLPPILDGSCYNEDRDHDAVANVRNEDKPIAWEF